MEAAPPSYEKATLVDYWDLVARYIPSSDLCSAALVCSRWHAIFVPYLWGNPASHFGIENDRVYVALTRFKRTLQLARLLVRSLTHTLHLPPAHAELYNGPRAGWLRDILERLPNLQSLIVRGLPFFDHSALQALRRRPPATNGKHEAHEGAIKLPGAPMLSGYSTSTGSTAFRLRLLDASRCPNVTSSGLAQALERFDALMYLDLSFTPAARDTVVLSVLRYFSGLQILKLRGLSLRDGEIEVLAPAMGLKVRSLDIRDNYITDRGVRILLDHCFTLHADTSNRADIAVFSADRSPALLPYLGTKMLEIYQGEDFEGYLRMAFTGSFVSRLAIEDAPAGGVTHLYIANNKLTVEGVFGLVRSGRLHVLDVGSVECGLARHTSVSERDHSDFVLPGIEKLIPVLRTYAVDALSFLRIDHGLITKDTRNLYPDEIVPGRAELSEVSLLPIPRDTFEVDAEATIFELSAAEQTPRYEPTGNPIQIVASSAVNEAPHQTRAGEETSAQARRGSAFATGVVESLTTDIDRAKLLSPVSAIGDDEKLGTPWPALTEGTGTLTSGTLLRLPYDLSGRPRSYSSAAMERKMRLDTYISQNHNLHPAMLPYVSTLVLTEVPPVSPYSDCADRLIKFIKMCAEEWSLAKQQAKLDYSLPPGRKGEASAIKQSADKIFALKRLVLEMGYERPVHRNVKASPWQHISTKSMTEDRDSEALWSAAESDFSFFSDGEDDGMPSLEPGRSSLASNEKEVRFGERPTSPALNVPSTVPRTPGIETIAHLSAFRKERRLAYESRLAVAELDPEVEGYWEGTVKVVWPSPRFSGDQEVDYYGTRFSGGHQ